jgi:hypothetical protein
VLYFLFLRFLVVAPVVVASAFIRATTSAGVMSPSRAIRYAARPAT